MKEKIKEIFTKSTISETSSTGTTGEYIIYAPFDEIIDDIVSLIEQPKTFEEAVEHLMKWLCENQHPHATVIVTGTMAELVEGIQCHHNNKFVVD
jgi:hypothetical protein